MISVQHTKLIKDYPLIIFYLWQPAARNSGIIKSLDGLFVRIIYRLICGFILRLAE